MLQKNQKTKEEDPLRELTYHRSQGIYNPDAVPRVHIVGCGGIGSWTAIAFSMAGCKDVHLYDDDELDVSNLNRLPFGYEDVGAPKTRIVEKQIRAMRPQTAVKCHGAVHESHDFKDVQEGDLVVICVDSAAQNNQVLELAEQKGARVIRGAYNGDSITVTEGIEQWDDTAGGYNIVPSYVVPPMVVAAMLVEKAYRDPKLEINAIPIAKLAMPEP